VGVADRDVIAARRLEGLVSIHERDLPNGLPRDDALRLQPEECLLQLRVEVLRRRPGKQRDASKASLIGTALAVNQGHFHLERLRGSIGEVG